MKRFVLFSVLLVASLSACGDGPTSVAPLDPESPLPMLVVDAEHFLTPNVFYDIPAGPGFILDASNYEFGTADGPTLVQVLVDGREYQGQWADASNVQPVRAAELLPPAGFKPLSGFVSGQQLIVAIGSRSPQGHFEPFWVAVVNVN